MNWPIIFLLLDAFILLKSICMSGFFKNIFILLLSDVLQIVRLSVLLFYTCRKSYVVAEVAIISEGFTVKDMFFIVLCEFRI